MVKELGVFIGTVGAWGLSLSGSGNCKCRAHGLMFEICADPSIWWGPVMAACLAFL